MDTLPFELLITIAESIHCADPEIIANAVNSLAATSKTLLAAARLATWQLGGEFMDPYMTTYAIKYTADYKYLNRFTIAKFHAIDNSPCICEYTSYSNSIRKLTSDNLNIVTHTPLHGLTYFEIFKTINMLRKGLRWAQSITDNPVVEILNLDQPVEPYGDESGLIFIDYLSNILSEIIKTETNHPDDEVMLNSLSEYFRSMIYTYSNYIHKINGDAKFMQLMESLLRSLKRERVVLPKITRQVEDIWCLSTPEMVNMQVCEYLKSFRIAFKFEYKITVSTGVY
jgi:hypothetical protein